MIAVIKWTLWEKRWFIFWWALGIAAFMVINLAFYPTFRDQAEQFNQVISNLSPTARSLIAGSNTGGFSTAEDFLNARSFYLMLPLLLSLLAILVGSNLIAKEENSGTLELLLSRPLARGRLLAAKATAGIIIIAAVSIAALMATLIIGSIVNIEVSVINIEVATLFACVLSLVFGAIAFMITTLGRSARAASAGVAAFIALLSYVVVSLSLEVDWLSIPAKLLPHNYYHSSDILYGKFGWYNALGMTIASAVFGAISWWAFRHRDIGT